MFDVIGKRNWFFAFSLLIMIPGIIAILLGPITGGKAGLQFAIDFTGGTVWSVRFEDDADHPRADRGGVRGPGRGDERHQGRRRVHGDPDEGHAPAAVGAPAHAGPVRGALRFAGCLLVARRLGIACRQR